MSAAADLARIFLDRDPQVLELVPVPFVLTDLGDWVVTAGLGVDWLETPAAAALVQLSQARIAFLVSRGEIRGRKFERRWLVERASLERYAASRRMGRPPGTPNRRPARPRRVAHLDPAPLLDRIERRGGLRACGGLPGSAEEAAFYRARRDGRLTLAAADRLSIRLLGLTMQEVWGDGLVVASAR